MVAATRSRSCQSASPKLAAISTGKNHARTTTRAAFAASVKKMKDEVPLSKKRAPASSALRSPAKAEIRFKTESAAAEDWEREELDDAHYGCAKGDQESTQETPSSISAAPSEYESLRRQRIAENEARMAALGMQKQAESLTSFFRISKPVKRPCKKSPITPVELRRRSERLKTNSHAPGFYSPSFTDRSVEEIERSPELQIGLKGRVYRNYRADDDLRPGNAPLPKRCPADLQVSPILSALRCRSKERGTLYDAIVGICCHFCRQKKLCGEEDCERCGQRDVTKACLGKTDCSKCHSSTGVFCRACLKIRYGEDIEEVRQRDDWLCPHCSEEEGSNPYWICNSSICLSRRKIAPTGIAIYKAREMGFKSVAHYLADVLKKQALK